MSVRQLAGTTAVVTGASRGFGRAIAVSLVEARRSRRGSGTQRGAALRAQGSAWRSIHPRSGRCGRPGASGSAVVRVSTEDPCAERRCDPGSCPTAGTELGQLQHELERRCAPGLQLRTRGPEGTNRPRLGGDQPLEWCCAAWIAAERWLCRSEGNDQVHQLIRELRGRAQRIGNPLRRRATAADAGDRSRPCLHGGVPWLERGPGRPDSHRGSGRDDHGRSRHR